jgi:hypothetical protein
LKSKFLISVGANFLLQDSQDTAYDFGPPRGLFVLILTAVSHLSDFHHSFPCSSLSLQYEKVVRAYKTGFYVSSGDFRAKSCNTWVKVYNKNFNKITAERWEDLLQHYDVAPDSEHERVGDMSILDEARAALPMSSP